MSTWPSEADPATARVPDAASESRLLEIRREAESKGRVQTLRRAPGRRSLPARQL